MITEVSIRNFKCLRDVQVDLERFTVFVGPNASGKSSILLGLNYLCHAFRSQFESGHFGFRGGGFGSPDSHDVEAQLTEAVSRGISESVELIAVTGPNQYRYQTRPIATQQTRPKSRSEWDSAGLGMSVAGTSDWKQVESEDGVVCPLPHSVLLRLESSKLIDPNPGQPDPSVMAPDGGGLHSALASMTLNDPDSWQMLQENLKRIIPTIRRLRHTKSAQTHQPTSILFDTIGADSLPATQISEGTLLVLGLLTALHAPVRPNLILLDDLDRGLHPKAQKELITLLRGLLETNPDLQIAATTHSPYMLDCMNVNEVRMTFLKDDGSTVCAALTSHPNFPRWKDEMTPGEMWSLFGEKWIAGDVAA